MKCTEQENIDRKEGRDCPGVGGREEQRQSILYLKKKKRIRWRKHAEEGKEWQGQFMVEKKINVP